MDRALCNECGKYVLLHNINGTVYQSSRVIWHYPDGEPLVAPLWRLDCYGGCARQRASLTQEPQP